MASPLPPWIAAPIPGYEPAPSAGNGNDKYYDDNAWLVITFLEAYQPTNARKSVDWTRDKLQDRADGLFDHRVTVATGEVQRGKLTYNSALMLRAWLALYRRDGRPEDLEHARRVGKAADWFLDERTGVYRDPLKWSHFMVEADLELYRATGDEHALRRARTNADAYYAAWKRQPPPDMMSNVCTARILWLLADMETPAGRAFWKAAEKGAEKAKAAKPGP